MTEYWTEAWGLEDLVNTTDASGQPTTVDGSAALGKLLTRRAAEGNELVQIVPGAGSKDGSRHLVVWSAPEKPGAVRRGLGELQDRFQSH